MTRRRKPRPDLKPEEPTSQWFTFEDDTWTEVGSGGPLRGPQVTHAWFDEVHQWSEGFEPEAEASGEWDTGESWETDPWS